MGGHVMPRKAWKKSELMDGLTPSFRTLTYETHGPDEILCHERVLAVKTWVRSLAKHERRLLKYLLGEWTLEQTATKLRMPKRTAQRRVQSLCESARRALAGVAS
jgi:hypothetical protein